MGGVACFLCGKLIAPWDDWDLDHRDGGNGYRGAAHAGCNRAAGAALTHRQSGVADPEPENTVGSWSRHWYGPANPRCPRCRALGGPCKDAEHE